MTLTKEQYIGMAIDDIELLHIIIGDLGYLGYKAALCRLQGQSYQQCANKYNLTKKQARCAWKKCCQKGHDLALKKLFNLK